jgi:HAE1 family hydrophobic/amphiphilic exporter-1
MDGNDLMDYAQSNLEKVLARVPGVGEVENFGSQYAMRIWLNPDKLTDYHLTVEDVIGALRSYNVEISAEEQGDVSITKLEHDLKRYARASGRSRQKIGLSIP